MTAFAVTVFTLMCAKGSNVTIANHTLVEYIAITHLRSAVLYFIFNR